ncbi:MAG: hypothetical protein LBG64_02265 [Pseudomonadales bacterium]|nr:hypothetical protein [Pseudomonadales bacterium]
MTFSFKKILLVVVTIAFLAFAVVMSYRLWRAISEPLYAPVDIISLEIDEHDFYFDFGAPHPVRDQPVIVYGFLPYWEMRNFRLSRVVTHVAYFGLTSDARGNFLRDGGWNSFHGPTYERVWPQILEAGKYGEIVIKMFNADDMWALLHCANCKNTLIDNIMTVVDEGDFTGVNIDFEYMGVVTPSLRRGFTTFMRDLRAEMDAYPRDLILSVDIYGDGARMYSIWEMQYLGNYADYIIVMGYDYHTRRSIRPGPVAPTIGRARWGNDILEGLRALLNYVDPSQVILAVPFYGYEWRVTSLDLNTARTYPGTGATMTYRRIQHMRNDRQNINFREHWDHYSLTPYLTYTRDGNYYIGFFDNARSIGYKMDLVRGLNLAGVAIWAMGYEGDSSELWRAIEDRLR